MESKGLKTVKMGNKTLTILVKIPFKIKKAKSDFDKMSVAFDKASKAVIELTKEFDAFNKLSLTREP